MALELTADQQARLTRMLDNYDEDLAELSWLVDGDDDDEAAGFAHHDEGDLFTSAAAQREVELAHARDRQRRDTELVTRGAKLRAWSAQYDEHAAPVELSTFAADGDPHEIALARRARSIDLAGPPPAPVQPNRSDLLAAWSDQLGQPHRHHGLTVEQRAQDTRGFAADQPAPGTSGVPYPEHEAAVAADARARIAATDLAELESDGVDRSLIEAARPILEGPDTERAGRTKAALLASGKTANAGSWPNEEADLLAAEQLLDEHGAEGKPGRARASPALRQGRRAPRPGRGDDAGQAAPSRQAGGDGNE